MKFVIIRQIIHWKETGVTQLHDHGSYPSEGLSSDILELELQLAVSQSLQQTHHL